MGWKSTIDITREDAMKEILRHLDDVPDEQLGRVLEEVLGGYDHGHNYRIVPRYSGDPDTREFGP